MNHFSFVRHVVKGHKQIDKSNILIHHGILGMHWGVRRYQPYGEGGYIPKSRNVHARVSRMPPDEYYRAKNLWTSSVEVDMPQREKERIYEELDNNLTDDEKESAIVTIDNANHRYTAINMGHNQYKIIHRELIDKPVDIVDEVLTEMFGPDWRMYLDDES